MANANPYTTPDAALDTASADFEDPAILSFNGRIGRLRYLAYSVGVNLLLALVTIPLLALSGFLGFDQESLIGLALIGLLYLGTFVISIAYGKRRLNDLNRSGWWVLLMFVPLINLLLVIYVVFFPGSDSANQFGAPPGPNSIGVIILAWIVPVVALLGIAAAILVPQVAG